MNLTAYPIRCQPIFRDYLWGGRNLEKRLGKHLPHHGVWAESWELLDHPEHSSLVLNGSLAGQTLSQVIANQASWLLGQGQTRLPLLLKYLDCHNVLSVQVHPDDAYAQKMTPADWGKTEAWYIVDAQPGAILYAGLKSGVDRKVLIDAIASGEVEQCLHAIQPKPGDCIFIPAGTVHALGAGLVVAEIQQSSNTTFRLYDWGRVGPDGNPRALHIEQSLAVTDFSSGPLPLQVPQPTQQCGRVRLVQSEKFCLDRLSGTRSVTVGGDGRFHFLTSFTGNVVLKGDSFCESVQVGESLILPAALSQSTVELQIDAVLLDMYLP